MFAPLGIHVPQEIIDAIISESAADPVTIAAWCLVSSRSCESAGPILYAEIRLTERNWEGCLSGSTTEVRTSRPMVLPMKGLHQASQPQPPGRNAQQSLPDAVMSAHSPTCDRLAHALSLSALRHLSVPTSILPLLDLSRLGKLARAVRLRPPRDVTLSVLDPTGSALESFCNHGEPLLTLLSPDRVVFNLDLIPQGVKETPLGLMDVIEGEVLRDFKTALSSSATKTAAAIQAADWEPDPPEAVAESYPDNVSHSTNLSASSMLLGLACAADARRLAAEERLIRQIKTCLRVLSHAPDFATNGPLIRAFFADVEPCEAAFKRRFVIVPTSHTGWLRVARPQTLDRTTGARMNHAAPFGAYTLTPLQPTSQTVVRLWTGG